MTITSIISNLINKTRDPYHDLYIEVLDACKVPRIGLNWVNQHRKLAVEEILNMDTNTNAQVRWDGVSLIWDEWITNNLGSEFHIEISTKRNHPYEIPDVRVKHPYFTPSRKIHVYSDGKLCLMHPNLYNSRISILQIRNMACAWTFSFEVYESTGIWPSAEHKH